MITAGERVAFECELPWVWELLAEGAAGALSPGRTGRASVYVRIEADRRPFATDGWPLLTRGARQRNGTVVVENACTAGFDLRLSCTPEEAAFTFRWRPPARDRAAARILRSRFHLLARAVLMQYPALWFAQVKGRAPLHASACAVDGSTLLLSSAAGVGRSTLVLTELADGARATGDNLAVTDGSTVWGLVEPVRVVGGQGRRMPHGRAEAPMTGRVDELVPDTLVVVERSGAAQSSLVPCSAEAAAHSLVTSTYMAGELRRYWALAATLAAGTAWGPAHAPVEGVASQLAAALPCYALELGTDRAGSRLAELLPSQEVPACA